MTFQGEDGTFLDIKIVALQNSRNEVRKKVGHKSTLQTQSLNSDG